VDSGVDRVSLLAFETRGGSKTMAPARLGTVVSAAVILYLPWEILVVLHRPTT